MMRKYKLIIFDVDGTLIDTSPGMINSLKYMFKKIGMTEPSDEELKKYVGPRIQDSLAIYANLHGEVNAEASKIFRERYKSGDVLNASLYKDVEFVLEELKKRGYYMSIATNKRQDFVDSLVDKYQLRSYFAAVYGTDNQSNYTKADLLRKCMKYKQAIQPIETVLIGDSDYDAKAAQEVKIDFLAAKYGYGFKSDEQIAEWNHIGIVNEFAEILKFF